jgi:hypothetical protein
MHIDIANGEVLPGVNGFDAAQALFKTLWKRALERVECLFRNVERCFPDPQHLRQAIAVVGMFVRDEDSVELLERDIARGEARQRFTFAKAAIHQKSGVLRFEQRNVARTAGSQDGDAQAYRSFSENLPATAK